MSIVLGDHFVLEKMSVFVVLIDEIYYESKLIITNEEGEIYDEINLLESDQIQRFILKIPMKYNVLKLEPLSPEKISSKAILDHGDKLEIIYLFSCDLLEADTRDSLFKTLSNDIDSGGRSLCLHLGDNIYADREWEKCKKHKDDFEYCLNQYRKRYQKTFFSRDRKEVYSKSSHLMIGDDHEVFNDFYAKEYDEKYVNIYNAAFQAYSEYQENLLYFDNPSINRGWYRMFEDNLIVTYDRNRGILSSVEIINSLGKIISETSPKGVIVAPSWAYLPSPRGNSNAELYNQMFGLNKFLPDFEIEILFDYLTTLVERGISVVLIGGDLHFGIHGRVCLGCTYFDLVVASPISNHPTYNCRLAAKSYESNILIGKYVFMPLISKGRRCYSRIRIDTNFFPRYAIDMVYNKQKKPKSYLKMIKYKV